MQVNKAENNVYTKKPSILKNIVSGAIVDLKLSVPVLSQYAMGDYFSKQTEIEQNLTGTQDGKEDGAIKNIANGAVKQLVYTIPVLGTYKVGQAKINHENLKDSIDAYKKDIDYSQKKKGAIRTYLTGLEEKAKLVTPVYGFYYAGKISNEIDNMLKDSQAINAKNNV